MVRGKGNSHSPLLLPPPPPPPPHSGVDDLVAFLKRVVGALVDGRGLIVIKENIGKEAVFDDTDSSVTR